MSCIRIYILQCVCLYVHEIIIFDIISVGFRLLDIILDIETDQVLFFEERGTVSSCVLNSGNCTCKCECKRMC